MPPEFYDIRHSDHLAIVVISLGISLSIWFSPTTIRIAFWYNSDLTP